MRILGTCRTSKVAERFHTQKKEPFYTTFTQNHRKNTKPFKNISFPNSTLTSSNCPKQGYLKSMQQFLKRNKILTQLILFLQNRKWLEGEGKGLFGGFWEIGDENLHRNYTDWKELQYDKTIK